MGLLREILAADAAYRSFSAESDRKRQAAREAAKQRRRVQVAAAERAVSPFARYVKGQTGEELLRRVRAGGRLTTNEYEALSPELQGLWRKALARQERDRDELREIADEMGFAAKYLLGLTPEGIRANRRRLARQERARERREWLDEHEAFVAEEVARIPFWRFSDDEFDKAERRALRRRQRRFDPDADFQED